MNNLCEVSSTGRGIHFDSLKEAEDFVAKFEVGVTNGLRVQPGNDGPEVSGILFCLGYRHIKKQGTTIIPDDSKVCLLKLLRSEGMMDKFAVQGRCAQEESLPELKPVEHEGYLLDYEKSTIRDREGHEFSIRFSTMKLFSLLSQTPQTFDELFKAYNALPTTEKSVARETLRGYIRQLEGKLGKDVIQITEDKKLVLRS